MSDDELDTALVEKAARAICAAEVEAGYSATSWDDPDNNRDWLRANARAALAAVDLPAVRAEAKAEALNTAAELFHSGGYADAAEILGALAVRVYLDDAAEVESGVTAQERGE